MKIRKAIDPDIDVIAQSYVKGAWEQGERMDAESVKEGIQDIIDDPARGMYLIAEDSNDVIAWMGVIRYDTEETGEVWEEDWHYIEPEHRKKGVWQSMRDYFSNNISKL